MDIVGYEDRVAMFVCGEYSAFFQLEEVKEGKFVPVKLLSVRSKEDSHWWDVDTAFHVMKWHKKNQLVSPIYQEVNVYREIIKEKAEFQKYVPWEKDFLKRVECIHFYEKENGEKTIVALKKSKWIKGKFDGYIKKIHIPGNFYDSEKKAVVLELLTAIDGYNKEPRKTPVGVEEYRRDESIGKHKFPWSISLYKGENRILIIPYLDHAAGFGQQPDKMVILEENASALEIGKGIGEVIEIIKTSPRLAGNTEGYRLATRYKGWKAFSKRNKLISIEVYEDFSYRLVAEEAKKGDGIYHTVMEAKKIDASVTEEELGKAVMECFGYFSTSKQAVDPYPTKEVMLSDDFRLLIRQPADKHFEDCEDCHAGELYQCYCYIPQEGAEASAEIFLGIAPELDCNLSPDNIQSAWENVYGKALSFKSKEEKLGIFTCCAELKNKSIHKLSYFLQMEEDLILECSMQIHQPDRRKKLDERLGELFRSFVCDCRRVV